jgi:hypothetical protein
VTFTIALKDAACALIKRMPENSTLNEILHEINLLVQIFYGLKDAEEEGESFQLKNS